MSKKKTIVSIARRIAELMYSVLKNKTEYKTLQWKGSQKESAKLAEQAISA